MPQHRNTAALLACLALTGVGLAFALPAAGMGSQAPIREAHTAKYEQSRKAQDAANSITFTDNAEIDNIKARIELTSKPGALGFITLLNQAGQPILYEGVRGKVTSGAKRLTKPSAIRSNAIGGQNGGTAYVLDQTPSDEGTWGSSGEYVFYWNTRGEYRQWNGPYLYSDKPYRLRVEPLVMSLEHAETTGATTPK